MFRILALSMLLVFCACTGGEPAGQQAPAGEQQAGAAPPAVPPNQQMINCLNRFREKKYDEAISACRQALSTNPGDPQILKAIELSEQALKQEGGA